MADVQLAFFNLTVALKAGMLFKHSRLCDLSVFYLLYFTQLTRGNIIRSDGLRRFIHSRNGDRIEPGRIIRGLRVSEIHIAASECSAADIAPGARDRR